MQVVVFVDYQNVLNGARESFHIRPFSGTAGQIDPLKLGLMITSRGLGDRELKEVRVYRGRPDSQKDPKTYGANLRQSERQLQRGGGKVKVIPRTLRYPPDWPQTPAQEKGIDVTLAVDFVQMAVFGEYDVGVIMSTDTDLKPALETVLRLPSDKRPLCEVAAWTNPHGHARRLSVTSAKIWCHWLDEADYLSVADLTDHNLA
jgi:NYN domain